MDLGSLLTANVEHLQRINFFFSGVKHHMLGAIFEVPIWQNGTQLWREAHFQVKMHKAPRSRSKFWKFGYRKIARRCGEKHICKSKCTKHLSAGRIFEVPMSKKWQAAVARSTFASQNVQSTTCSEQFLKFRSGKTARRSGAKRACKSKCAKHLRFGTLLELLMWKRCPTEEIDRLILR